MKYTIVKKASDVKLEGVKVTFDQTDASVVAVYLKDAKGNVVRIKAPYSQVQIEIPVPPEIEKRYVVTADVPGLGEVKKTFTNESEAKAAMLHANHSVSLSSPATMEEEAVVVDAPKDDGSIPF